MGAAAHKLTRGRLCLTDPLHSDRRLGAEAARLDADRWDPLMDHR